MTETSSTPTMESDGSPRRPKYMELREQIRRQIEAGSLRPGSAIQTEPELARRHSVSISTVKEALKDLVEDGLIVRVRGRGTFVSQNVRKTQTVLPLLTPLLGSGLTRSFYLGYEERSVSLGLSTVLWSTRQILEGDPGEWGQHPLLRDIQALAIITSGAGEEAVKQDTYVVSSLLKAGKKVVLVDQDLPNIEGDLKNVLYLGTRNLDAMLQLGRHLIAQGCRRIGFVGIQAGCYTQEQRFLGLRLAAALAQEHVEVLDPLMMDGPFMELHNRDFDSLPEQGMERMVAYARNCDAVCAVNDLMAALVLRVLRRRGVEVPKDCAVTGFDDSEIASTTHPPLTTVRQPFREMGACAVDLVMALHDGKLRGFARWIVEPTLVLRESSNFTRSKR